MSASVTSNKILLAVKVPDPEDCVMLVVKPDYGLATCAKTGDQQSLPSSTKIGGHRASMAIDGRLTHDGLLPNP